MEANLVNIIFTCMKFLDPRELFLREEFINDLTR